MKKNCLILIFITCLMGLPLFAGGTQESPVGSDGPIEKGFKSVTVTDFLGRTVTIDKPVESIAFIHYSSAEAVKILGAWDLVVARDGYTNDKVIYPNLDEIPALITPLGDAYAPNMEKLLELSPDLFILEVLPVPGMKELLDDLEGLVTVVTVKTYEPDEMVNSFRCLGALLDRKEKAEEFISWSLATQDMIMEKTDSLSETEKATLFFKTAWNGPEDLMTFSDGLSYIPARNRIAGVVNVAADLPSRNGWVPQIDPEWLTSTDYEYLLIGDPQWRKYGVSITDTKELDEYRTLIMENPVFASSTAVKNENVFMLADVFFGTPRHIVGFAYIAKWCHPELFLDISPLTLYQEYLNRFLGVAVDLEGQGVFVYPEQ